MPVARSGRLFHAIVVVGVSLTGGTLASCGETASTAGDVDAGGRDNLADGGIADGSSLFDGNRADRNIADSGVVDRSVADDYYTSIVGYAPDAYVRTPADAALNPDGQVDAAPSVDACYSCIHPLQPDGCAPPYDCIAPP
jgi:hypothetical protein